MDQFMKGLTSHESVFGPEDVDLHEILTQGQIRHVKQVFSKYEGKRMNRDQLQVVLEKYAQISIPTQKFNRMFLQMNIAQNGFVTWDEFLTFLIIGQNNSEVPVLASPLDSPLSQEPRLFKSNHRHPINCISFNYNLNPDRSISYDEGRYVSLSKDGFINFWSLDFQIEKTLEAKPPEAKVTEPANLCMACLPDVSIIALGSTQRDIRFYDISAQKFTLRIHFTTLDFSVCSMSYVYAEDINVDAKLIFGDTGGNIFILYFSAFNRGPFRSVMDVPILTVKFSEILKGSYKQFTVAEFRNLHNDWVKQVEIIPMLNTILSCSPSPPSLVLNHLNDGSIKTFNINRGVWCFAFSEAPLLICTGAADGMVRVWNPYIFNKPIGILRGHHTGVIALIIQDGFILCSLSMDRTIRIWNLIEYECLQTYNGLSPSIGEFTEFVMFYNIKSREVLIGGIMLAVFSLRPCLSPQQTDGYSHTGAISVLLYNPLFRKVVSCGLDSRIIVWDPFNGKRILVIHKAHTRHIHGEVIPVDITAGTFDVGYQCILTGAFDGTLKTWHMNTGHCLRNLRIESGCEVTGVCWPKDRILAIGWNRYVVEFPEGDLRTGNSVQKKAWSIKHTGDVLFAASKIPEALATSTYNGELIFWALETGQPYKIISVANPTLQIKVTFDYDAKKAEKPRRKSIFSRYGFNKRAHLKSSAKAINFKRESSGYPALKSTILREEAVGEIELKYTSKLKPPPTIVPIRGLAVRCMIFLKSRETHPQNASLLVALENGDIQAWSHHRRGGFLKAFQATHTLGDYVLAMATDLNNEYLFAGSTEGYIKTFLMKGYLTKNPENVPLFKYRANFSFMWQTDFLGRAERTLINQKFPVMLNSYKAHRGIVSELVYIHDSEILISSSSDWSIRLWTLEGRYINTLGTFKPWQDIPYNAPVDKDFPHNLPSDLRTIMSSTSYKVFMGKDFKRRLTKKQAAQMEDKKYNLKEENIFGVRLQKPVLGNHVSMSEKTTKKYEFDVKPIGTCIPIYQHLPPVSISELPEIRKPRRLSTIPKNML